MKFKFLLVVGVLFFHINGFCGSFYLAHPRIKVVLGGGYDVRNPSNDLSANGCFNWIESTISKQSLYSNLNINSGEISSHKQLMDTLNISSSVSARLGFLSGGATANLENKMVFDSKSVIYAISGRQEFSSDYLPGTPELSVKGKYALNIAAKNNNIMNFIDICGTDIVTTVNRGIDIAVFHSFSAENSETIKQLRSSVSGKYLSISGKVSIENINTSLSTQINSHFDAYQSGGGEGKPNLMNLINSDPFDLGKIKEKISEVAAAFNRENSPITSFQTLSVIDLPEVRSVFGQPLNYEISEIDNELLRLRSIKTSAEIMKQQLIEIINSPAVNPAFITELQSRISDLDLMIIAVKDSTSICLKASKINDCKKNIGFPPELDISKYILKFAEPIGWMWNPILTSSGKTDFTGTVVIWPQVRFYYTNQIESVMFLEKNNVIGQRISGDQLSSSSQSPFSLRNLVSETFTIGGKAGWCWEADGPCKGRLLENTKKLALNKYQSNDLTIDIKLKNGKNLIVKMPRFSID